MHMWLGLGEPIWQETHSTRSTERVLQVPPPCFDDLLTLARQEVDEIDRRAGLTYSWFDWNGDDRC